LRRKKQQLLPSLLKGTMKTYRRFEKSDIDLASLGIIRRKDPVTYFCTPKNAEIIGWSGVDGVHYCFIRGFGSTVFEVDPTALPGEYVHPIAGSFRKLLSMLLTCGDINLLSRARFLSEEELRKEVFPFSEEQKAVFSELGKHFHLTPAEDICEHVRELGRITDLNKIKYTEDFFDTDMNPDAPWDPPEWQVRFGSSFFGRGTGRPGKEIRCDGGFEWYGRKWMVPAVYFCTEGVVIDLFARGNADEVRDFLYKCTDENAFSTENERGEFARNNPLDAGFSCTAYVNGKALTGSASFGMHYIPKDCLPEPMLNPREAEYTAMHYGLDASCPWLMRRMSFLWSTKRRPDVRSLGLRLKADLTCAMELRFEDPSAGDSFDFKHPVTGESHRLTITGYDREVFPAPRAAGLLLPTHYYGLGYRIEPDIPQKMHRLSDVLRNDEPKRKARLPHEPESTFDAAIAVIGGADGPTAFSVGVPERSRENTRYAMSALHFEPAEHVSLKLQIFKKPAEDLHIDIIGKEKS